jgi:hypothetical protein
MRKSMPGATIAALMIATPAMACETAGGPYEQAWRAEYDQVHHEI